VQDGIGISAASVQPGVPVFALDTWDGSDITDVQGRCELVSDEGNLLVRLFPEHPVLRIDVGRLGLNFDVSRHLCSVVIRDLAPEESKQLREYFVGRNQG
jgi:hypothetical protein